MALHKFTRLIDRGEEIPVYGDGSSRRDYTYIDDLVDGILGVVQYHKGFEVYNLGESQTTTLKELIRLIEEAFGKKANVEMLEFQPGDVSVTFADISKAERMLKYQPKVKMEEGIKRFVEWYKAQRA
jgi:UDP-glucuronate 4-epimerase